MTTRTLAAVGAVIALAVAAPSFAQGKSGNGNGNGGGKAPKSTPPSHSPLASVTPAVAASAPAAVGGSAMPFAWVDDASVLPQGVAAASISMMGWYGSDLSQSYAPVVGLSAGVTPRLQVGASLPHVVANDTNGVAGGMGTAFLSAKLALVGGDQAPVKIAAAPTIEILGPSAQQSFAPGTGRAQFGVPVSVEVDHDALRTFVSGGGFTPGVWFIGGGLGAQVTKSVGLATQVSQSRTSKTADGSITVRHELSASAAYTAVPRLSVFGSISRTFATSDQNGAGTTLSGGLVVLLSAPHRH